MKQRDMEVIISIILILTLILGFLPNNPNLNPKDKITGLTLIDGKSCQPYSQKCGIKNVRFECNSHGEWYEKDCPITDYCTEIDSVTAECN